MKILNKDVTLPEAATWSDVKTKSGCLIYIPFRSEYDADGYADYLKFEASNM